MSKFIARSYRSTVLYSKYTDTKHSPSRLATASDFFPRFGTLRMTAKDFFWNLPISCCLVYLVQFLYTVNKVYQLLYLYHGAPCHPQLLTVSGYLYTFLGHADCLRWRNHPQNHRKTDQATTVGKAEVVSVLEHITGEYQYSLLYFSSQ